jgi:uncharacterized membrane protein/cytochrome c2
MTLLSWPELHGALTHIPVAFLLAVAVFEVGALLFRKPEWRTVSFWLLVGAVIIAVPSLITGWITGNDLKFTGNGVHSPGIFVTHRLFAFTTSGLAILLLLWRVKAQDQLDGRALGASILLSLLMAAGVSYTGFLGGRMIFGGAEPSSAFVPLKPTDKVAVPVVAPELVAAGQKQFNALPCRSCHRMDGKGGISGPDLTHEARRHADMDWHIAHLKDPQKMKPGSDMPPFDSLPPNDLKALAAYLVTRK